MKKISLKETSEIAQEYRQLLKMVTGVAKMEVVLLLVLMDSVTGFDHLIKYKSYIVLQSVYDSL